MLIAHATSTCDVCLEGYQEDCSYHSIPCGHVFCLPCLVSTSPPKCPLCRHEFTPHSMRKVHLTLPSARDIAARKLELKLVQSSPETTLAESLMLFQEVQEWLEGEAQDEFLVLRAFAAVLCSFHETKDKLLQTEARAEKTEAALLRSLDEARSATSADVVDHKAKYEATKSELDALRTECAELRAQAEQVQQRSAEIQAFYAQAQIHAQIQSEPEPTPVVRRISNPLPTPPRPIEIPFLKLIENRPSLQSQESQGNKGKAKDIAEMKGSDIDVDPMTSVYVPTLSASITTKNSSTSNTRSEVTTLVFKPPKRIPVWDLPITSYERVDAPRRVPPSTLSSDSSSRTSSYSGVNDRAEHSRTSEHPQVDKSYASSSLNLAWSEYTAPRHVTHIDGNGRTNVATGPVSRHAHPPSRAFLSGNNDRPESSPRSGVPAPLQPVSYQPSHATQDTQPGPLSRPIPLVASQHREPRLVERKNMVSWPDLRRASSPAVMPPDPDMRSCSIDMSHLFPPCEDCRKGGGRMVPAPANTGGSVGEGPSDLEAGEKRRQQRASVYPRDPRGIESSEESRFRRVRNEYVPSLGREAMEFPPSPAVMGVEHRTKRTHRTYNSPTSHGHSDSLSSDIDHGIPRPTSSTPTRARAHSHSHTDSYPASVSPLRGRQTADISPMRRRLTLDASSAGPAVPFQMLDQRRPRVVPVGEV